MLKDAPFPFRYKATVEAAAFLLRKSPNNSASYFRLLKLLYLADRESINQVGRPITGDRPFAFDHGPSLSRLLNIVNDQEPESPFWARFIARDGFTLSFREEPGNLSLAPFELDILSKVIDEHRNRHDWQLSDWTHTLQEWIKNKPPRKKSKPIKFIHILEALGKASLADKIEQQAREEACFSAVFGA